MPHRHLLLLASALLLLGALPPTGAGARGPAPMRAILATIEVDGELVLRASTGDDGRADADEVWSYLLEGLDFEPTEHFAALGIDPAAERVTLGWLKGRATEALGDPPRIELDVEYGGRSTPYQIALVRAPSGKTWRVGRETVEGFFEQRWITRRQASLLEDPRRKQ